MHGFNAQDVFSGRLPANRLRRCISVAGVVLSEQERTVHLPSVGASLDQEKLNKAPRL